jgi:hypothetical protein
MKTKQIRVTITFDVIVPAAARMEPVRSNLDILLSSPEMRRELRSCFGRENLLADEFRATLEE